MISFLSFHGFCKDFLYNFYNAAISAHDFPQYPAENSEQK